MGTRTVSYFVDTNLFLQCRPLEQLEWTDLGDFEEVRLIVSRPVQREIDYGKNKGSGRLAKRARTASALFRQMMPDGQQVVRESGPRVILSVEPQHPYRRDPDNRLDDQERDDQLVGTLHEFARRHADTDARLLTHDTTPLYTARGLGLVADVIPDGWLLPPESTASERELTSLRSENARLKKAEPSCSIRCVDRSGVELEDYHADVVSFEPLTDEQVDELMQRLQDRFPLATDFGSRRPTVRTVKQQPAFDWLAGTTDETYTPATDEQIRTYREEDYPKWLERCEEILRAHDQVLQHRVAVPELSFLTENNGTRPATDTLVTIEAEGDFRIQPPPTDGRDDEPNGERHEPPAPDTDELPRPPVAPHGRWQLTSRGYPGDALRNLAMLGRSLSRRPNFDPPTVSEHVRRIAGLHTQFALPDPNAFYYKPERPSSPRSSFSLSSDQWRHGNGEEPFGVQIPVPADRDKIKGALVLRIQAANLSDSASKRIPVRIAITRVSAFESAISMVEELRERPSSEAGTGSG